jgi:hypothetical protein
VDAAQKQLKKVFLKKKLIVKAQLVEAEQKLNLNKLTSVKQN